MSKIKHILYVIHYTICGAICFQFTHFCCNDWDNIYTLSYYHHQIGSMNYYPLFRARSWNNGVHCMSFYILMETLSALFMMTSSNVNIFRVTDTLWNSPVTGEFPSQRPVTRSFDVFFDLRLNKRLSKQSWGCWFEKPSRILWRHCNVAFWEETGIHLSPVESPH